MAKKGRANMLARAVVKGLAMLENILLLRQSQLSVLHVSYLSKK